MNPFRRYRLPLATLIAAMALMLTACSSGDAESNVSDSLINEQQVKWAEQRIRNYTLVDKEFGGGPDAEVTVEVRDEKIDDVDKDVERFRPGGSSTGGFTVEGLFDLVRRAKDDARKITVRFDNDRGFPDNIFVDWARGGLDEEYILEVVSFTPR